MSPHEIRHKKITNADDIQKELVKHKDDIFRLFNTLRAWFPIWITWQQLLEDSPEYNYINLDDLYEQQLLDRVFLPYPNKKSKKLRASYRISSKGLDFIGNLESHKTNKLLRYLTNVLIIIGITQVILTFIQIWIMTLN